MSDLSQWAEQRFEGLSPADLRKAGKELGATFGPHTSEATMRKKLCEIVGAMPVASQEAPAATPARLDSRFDPKPNLTSTGQWGGRRHHVTLHQPSENTENSPKYARLYHECEPRDYPYNVQIDLPEPLYNNLKRAQTGDLEERKILDAEGVLVRIEHIPRMRPRYPHQYHGPVPGTENLPGSLAEYWHRQAVKTNNFEGVPRRTLITIRADLYGPAGRAFYKDLTDQDILFDILQFLGIDELAEVA